MLPLKWKTVFILILCIGAWMILGACSDNPPAILQHEWRITLFYNRLLGVSYQKLSVFIRAEDEDGSEDLGALYIINDDAELFWTVEPENWEKVQNQGKPWIGTNSIVMPDSITFPVGSYRILLEDKSGKVVETSFYLKRQNIETTVSHMPQSSNNGETIQITGSIDSPEVWVYDANDNFLFNFIVQEMSIPLETIISKNNALKSGFSYYVSGKDKNGYYYLTNGPFYYSPE
jgi:hypothetical protein